MRGKPWATFRYGAWPLLCESLGILKTGHNHVGITRGKGSRHADLTAGTGTPSDAVRLQGR